MDRVIDFVRMIVYVLVAIVIYLGVNQLLAVAEPWSGYGLIESVKQGFDGLRVSNSDHNEVELIDRYLASKKSPMAGQGYNFVRYGREYNVPPRLMVAMTGAESNFGQKGYAVGTNNPVGLGVHEGRSYQSWEESIKDLSFVLRNYYFDEGREDPMAIQNKWAPRCVDGNGCDNSWAENVDFFMTEMNSFS